MLIMAAQQPAQNINTLDDQAVHELIQQLLRKRFVDMANDVSKLLDANKKLIRNLLCENYSLISA